MAVRTVAVRLLADVAGYMSGMGRAAGATRQLGGELDKTARGGRLEAVTRTTAALGLGLVGVAGAAVKLAADFDKQMSAVSAATHATAGDLDDLRQAAIVAGKDTQFSATQAAQGITELAKAGVSTKDILAGGLKGALDLAAAGQLSVAEAAETSASALTQFRLSGDKVPHVADLLAAAAGKAQGSVHDVGEALNQSGLVAAQFGLSIEDTTGVLAQFASAGLKGSDAGTSLKTMLLALANPSDVTKKKMSDLGISFYDAQGRFIGLSGVAQVLQTRLKGLTEEQRNAALGQIFGNDAIRSASILYRDGAVGVEKWRGAVNDAGYASETAAKLTDNLAGDIERLRGSLETMAIQSGSGANSGLRALVKMAGSLVDKFSALPPVVGSSITVLAGVSGAALLAAAGWLKARKASAEFRTELEKMGPAGEKAAGGLSRVQSAAGKAAGAFALLQTAGAVINNFQSDLNPQLDALASGLEDYARSGQTAGEASRVLGKDLDTLKYGFAFFADTDNGKLQWSKHIQEGLEAIVPGLNGTNTSLAKTKERIEATDAALSQLVSGGHADEANAAFQKLAEQLAVGGVTLDEVKAQFPQFAAALESAKNASIGVAGATGDLNSALGVGADQQEKYATKAEAAAGAARGELDALTALASQLKAETDPVFGFLDAQSKLNDAQKTYNKAIKEHGKNSQEAKAALRELTGAAITLEGSAGTLAQTFNGQMDPALRATLKSAGLTDKQIDAVAKQFVQAKKDGDKFAKDYKANTTAPGATEADRQLKNAKKSADSFDGIYKAAVSTPGSRQAQTDMTLLWNRLKDVDGNWVAHLKTSGYAGVAGNLRHLLAAQQALKNNESVNEANRELGHFFATGGPVYGPGGPTSDSIPAMLSAGEHVWTAAEVAALGGQQVMLRLRAAVRRGKNVEVGDVPPEGFAGGGAVYNLPFPTDVKKTKIPKVDFGFGHWPSSPSAQRGDSGVWKKIVALVANSGIPYHFGNAYRPGDPLWHGSGRAVDFMGYNQDRLAQFFLARQGQVLELIHRTNSRDYGITRGHYNAMPHQWPLHRNHLHVAMQGGGTITEPIFGMGASGRSYSFGENWMPETVTPGYRSGGGGATINLTFSGPVGSRVELQNWLTHSIDDLKRKGRL